MSIVVNVNGESINYPQTGDTNWGDEATDFAVQTSSAFAKVGLSTGTTVDLPGTLDVTGNTTLDANLSVGGNASVTGNLTVNGNTQLGNANTDSIGVTGIVNIDSGVLYVDPVNNRVGINDTTPSQALDVTGNVAITGNTTIAGTLGVTGNTTIDGVIYADDDTTANTPVISFIGDTNTGIGRSASDTLDFITNGNTRFRIESTGQIKAVYESTIGTDYNTTLHNGYLCRAWVNFNGTGTVAIRASGNVTSITDNGTGDYTVNYATAMPDENYCCYGFSRQFETGTTLGIVGIAEAATPSVSSINIRTFDAGVGFRDSAFVSFGVFR